MDYQLNTVRIFVSDWAAAVRFYRDVLELPQRFSNAEMGWAEFDVGGPSLALERVQPGDEEGDALTGRFLGVSLAVENIDAVHQRLAGRGVSFLGPPRRQPRGGVLAHLRDPEDNVLTLLESRRNDS